jgi:hypothetical protein
MDTAPERYALNVASATAAVSGLQLAGAYLHGSAVLGGFNARRSDVDVLAVCDGPMTAAQQSAVAEALSEQRLPCPGRTPPASTRCSTRVAYGGSPQMAHWCPRSMAASGLLDESTAPAAS